jgi:hypothetical protein
MLISGMKFCRIFVLLSLLFSCNGRGEKNTGGHTVSLEQKQANPQEHPIDCNVITDKLFIYNISHSIIDKDGYGRIWNLSEIDTTDVFTTEDYFINATTKNRLVVIGGEAGLSAGSADHLLLMFSCTDSLRVVWYEQTGKVTPADITDVNGDGIKEIVSNTGYVWMGECGDHYSIFNFKDGNKNILFSAQSISLLGCGHDDLAEPFKQGDTVENSFNCKLQKQSDKTSAIRQIQTVKIYQGGKTDEEITKRLKIIIDTTEIPLK